MSEFNPPPGVRLPAFLARQRPIDLEGKDDNMESTSKYEEKLASTLKRWSGGSVEKYGTTFETLLKIHRERIAREQFELELNSAGNVKSIMARLKMELVREPVGDDPRVWIAARTDGVTTSTAAGRLDGAGLVGMQLTTFLCSVSRGLLAGSYQVATLGFLDDDGLFVESPGPLFPRPGV